MKDDRSRKAVSVAISYGRGKANDAKLQSAAISAQQAVGVARTTRATHPAAYAAAYSAYTATRTSRSPRSAGVAAYTACDAAAYAAIGDYDEAYAAAQQHTADICREVLTSEIIKLIKP
jgi:hypothetical protein